jgi:nitrite reductase (NADH) small subunit
MVFTQDVTQVPSVKQVQPRRQVKEKWIAVCPLSRILPNMGAAVLVKGHQIALFRLPDNRVFAISNYDPFSEAFVISRGIVGDRQGELKVASPIYKQSFSLLTGKCLDDANVTLQTWPVRVVDELIEVCI